MALFGPDILVGRLTVVVNSLVVLLGAAWIARAWAGPVEDVPRHAQQLADDELSNWAPGLSLLSMQHEVQYSRIYRS